MAYDVKNTAGTVIATVADTKTDKTATSLSLVGYKTTKYGLDTAENFVHLLEHFANDSAPPNPMTGQLWFDTSSNTLKVYHNNNWTGISGTPSTSGDPTQGGLSGVYHCPIDADGTSVLLLFAGGKIVAVICSVAQIVQAHLPSGVTIEATEYAFQSLFPFGLVGGVNLADDGTGQDNATDYVFAGRVPVAEQAHFAGGGVNASEVSGWGFLDLGPGQSVGLMISGGKAIAAVSANAVQWSSLPVNGVVLNVKSETSLSSGDFQENGTSSTVTVDLRGAFVAKTYQPLALVSGNLVAQGSPQSGIAFFPGITYAAIGGTDLAAQGTYAQIIQSVAAASQSANGTALAQAVSDLHVWVDNNSATAQKVTDLEATFTTATGTSTMAAAVQALIATATDTSATSAAITDLKSQFQSALGTSSFGEALSKLSTASTQAGSASDAVTSITSAFINQFGGTNIASAVSNLYTRTDQSGNTVAGYTLALNSNGYVTGIQAANGGASSNYFKVTTSNFIVGDNNIDFIPFQIVNGVVTMHSVEVDTLKNNSAVVPARAASTQSFYGTSGSTSDGSIATTQLRQILVTTIHMVTPGYIECTFTCKQGFHNGLKDRPWLFATYVNNQMLNESLTGGTVPGDSIATSGTFYATTAGDYTVEVRWQGHNTISVESRGMFVKGFPFTS